MKIKSFALIAISSLSLSTVAQDITRASLPKEHPLVGIWRIDLPDQKCFEEYEVKTDGTKLSQSAEERNESEFVISLAPSAKGFYKWTDRITKGNGKPDCSGSLTPNGNVAVNYIRLHSSGRKFLLCSDEEISSCYAEFYRKK